MNHIPVLLEEVIIALKPEKGKYFIDATLDGGGHSEAILSRTGKHAKLLGIDRDPEMIERANIRFKNDSRFIATQGNFSDIYELASLVSGSFDGILFDLGMSSMQLEASGRGFSFLKDEPLDMRYNPIESLTAEEIINNFSEKEIARIILEYGEERFAKRIARRIVDSRKKKRITQTGELRNIISFSVPAFYRRSRIDPATRTFQALRIAVNDELNAIHAGLEGAWKLLGNKGRLVVITFHSLEDRIVKRAFVSLKQKKEGELFSKKPIIAKDSEIEKNPRARSAKLRAITKIF